jgi:hypothetical protein
LSDIASSVQRLSARLHLIGGDHIIVSQPPEEVARLLWGREEDDSARSVGYAALQVAEKPVYVNPASVAYVTPDPIN